jgi:hypothetical protein
LAETKFHQNSFSVRANGNETKCPAARHFVLHTILNALNNHRKEDWKLKQEVSGDKRKATQTE